MSKNAHFKTTMFTPKDKEFIESQPAHTQYNMNAQTRRQISEA
jgi:hypothetical protein